jgi:hypothetical protein
MRLDPLIEALTAGTARQGTRPPLPSPLAEAMLEAPDASPSLRLLYAAGVRALEHTIGRLPSSELPLPAPAELDPRPPCRPRAAALVQQLLSGSHDGLLPETLERIHAAGQRLPHALLPLALGVRRAELRAKVRPLLGPRGRWLAAHSPSFAWALEVPSSLEALARAWAEGTAAVRRDALDKGRRLDAGVALSWLIDTWAHEKADDRAVFVGVLEVGLSPADEPFLERALDDRSAKVRSGAAQLLARLPSSTFVARMKARAVGALQLRKQQLVVHDPQPAPRDGLPEGAELRGLRLAAVLAAVSPADEARRLGLSAEALLALARRTTDLSSLAEGWSRAAVRLGDAEWALALWATWATADDKTIDKSLAGEHMQALLGVLPAEQAAGALSARPPQWQLSPWAVVTYLMGGTLPNGVEITPKYIGSRRLIEIAIATLATDRALLLLGVPGTAKSWVSSTWPPPSAATPPAGAGHGRHQRGSPALRLELRHAAGRGPLPRRWCPARCCAPCGRPLARVEELTRIPADVQDTLITLLSEKTLPVPELGIEVQAAKGFNVIATANNRDKGVNDLSAR